MTATEIRAQYLKFFTDRGHVIIPRANLVPQDDPTTLFTTAGMQPLLPYLLGETHPEGTELVDSQTCLRSQDIDEVGDNRHTTFFEMLGNWSLGTYFKAEQLPYFFEFLTKTVGLDPAHLYATCFSGDENHKIPRDDESAEIWQRLFGAAGIEAQTVEIGSEANGYSHGMQDGRIFFYDATKNWWCRAGLPDQMPPGEPGGPDTELFYEFEQEHDPAYGMYCHPNCDCGRFMEIGNTVFMEYVKTEVGFTKLPKQNVDFGGGLERIAAAANDDPDIFKIDLLWPVIKKLEQTTRQSYADQTESMRVITDHLRAAVWLGVDGVVPSNTQQGYVLRRLIRRAIRHAHGLDLKQDLMAALVPVITKSYHEAYPEVGKREAVVLEMLIKEEKLFRQTLERGLREFQKLAVPESESPTKVSHLKAADAFRLYDTNGFPLELTREEAQQLQLELEPDFDKKFEQLMSEQRDRSRTATKGQFQGGLADHSEIVTKYHTATHLMYKALRMVLGDHVIQRGSNITAERLRFDFSQPEKLTPEQIKRVEEIVNEQIEKDWPMSWREENTKAALAGGVMGAFGDRYGDVVKVYTVGDPDGEHYSREICGGPHVEHTGQLGEGGKRFKITKEESSSAGVRRVKAILT